MGTAFAQGSDAGCQSAGPEVPKPCAVLETRTKAPGERRNARRKKMPQIKRIEVHIRMARVPGSRPDGDLYIGVGGREFGVALKRDDLLPEEVLVYAFGENPSPLKNAEKNDPSGQRLTTETLRDYPVYARYEPDGKKDNWCIEDLRIVVNGGGADERRFRAAILGMAEGVEASQIWLGRGLGKMIYLAEEVAG